MPALDSLLGDLRRVPGWPYPTSWYREVSVNSLDLSSVLQDYRKLLALQEALTRVLPHLNIHSFSTHKAQRYGVSEYLGDPEHSHERAGIWDSDNGPRAGKPCESCMAWKKFRQAVRDLGLETR